MPATLKLDPVQEIHLGNFVAGFEKTTLSEIRNAIGTGSIDHRGDAAESQYWLCYSQPGQRVRLVSSEMGGSKHKLTQVYAVSTNSASLENKSYPQLPKRFQPISFYFGWIGSTQQSLIDML